MQRTEIADGMCNTTGSLVLILFTLILSLLTLLAIITL